MTTTLLTTEEKKTDETTEDDNEENEVDDEDDEEEEEEVDEEGEPDYIWLSPSEFNDPNIPYLFGAPVNPNSSRSHSRRQKTADSLFPHLSDTLYRCKEYPHGIYVNSYGQLCPDDKRSGLYQIDERAAEEDTKAEPADDEEEDEEEDEEMEEEDKDNDQDAPPDTTDVTWVSAENAIRTKKGLKRKKVIPDDDEDEYKPETDNEEEEEEDDKAEEGDAEEVATDDEFKDEDIVGTDDDNEWDPEEDKKEREHSKKQKTNSGSEEEDEDEDDKDSDGKPLPKESDEYELEEQPPVPSAPIVELTPEQRKEAFIKSMQVAEERQAAVNIAAEKNRQQRIKDQKNLRMIEDWSEEWKRIRNKTFREEKAAEKDLEKRKLIQNTSITMTFDTHILSKENPGCDFTFRKPVKRPKKGQSGPKPVPFDPIHATFDCNTSEIICGKCTNRFSSMVFLYQHLSEHFMEMRVARATASSNTTTTPPNPPAATVTINLFDMELPPLIPTISTNPSTVPVPSLNGTFCLPPVPPTTSSTRLDTMFHVESSKDPSIPAPSTDLPPPLE